MQIEFLGRTVKLPSVTEVVSVFRPNVTVTGELFAVKKEMLIRKKNKPVIGAITNIR